MLHTIHKIMTHLPLLNRRRGHRLIQKRVHPLYLIEFVLWMPVRTLCCSYQVIVRIVVWLAMRTLSRGYHVDVSRVYFLLDGGRV